MTREGLPFRDTMSRDIGVGDRVVGPGDYRESFAHPTSPVTRTPEGSREGAVGTGTVPTEGPDGSR